MKRSVILEHANPLIPALGLWIDNNVVGKRIDFGCRDGRDVILLSIDDIHNLESGFL